MSAKDKTHFVFVNILLCDVFEMVVTSQFKKSLSFGINSSQAVLASVHPTHARTHLRFHLPQLLTHHCSDCDVRSHILTCYIY